MLMSISKIALQIKYLVLADMRLTRIDGDLDPGLAFFIILSFFLRLS